MRRHAWRRATWDVADRRAWALGLLVLAAVFTVLALPASAKADPTPPTVTITSPSQGSTLRGLVTVSADATAGTNPVASIDFVYDDPATSTHIDLGSDSTAPYSETFDTASVPNCEQDGCTISAIPTDNQNNTFQPTVLSFGIANPIVVDSLGDGRLRQLLAAERDRLGDQQRFGGNLQERRLGQPRHDRGSRRDLRPEPRIP